jgi:HAD superfamily hydrolase (TIGR01509 family)
MKYGGRVAAYDLLIFDFDGTLVPTEELANRLMRPMLGEHLQVHLSEDEMVEHFRGRDLDTQFAIISGMFGAPIPETFLEALEEAWTYAVKNELEPSTGAIDALEQLRDIPRCIASNGYREGINMALEATGLDRYFDEFLCADDVENPKPDPDMFLLAASRHAVTPNRCLVIEDSVLGTRAARAAGMDVVGYVGNDPRSEGALHDAGAHVIHHFSELVELVNRNG